MFSVTSNKLTNSAKIHDSSFIGYWIRDRKKRFTQPLPHIADTVCKCDPHIRIPETKEQVFYKRKLESNNYYYPLQSSVRLRVKGTQAKK